MPPQPPVPATSLGCPLTCVEGAEHVVDGAHHLLVHARQKQALEATGGGVGTVLVGRATDGGIAHVVHGSRQHTQCHLLDQRCWATARAHAGQQGHRANPQQASPGSTSRRHAAGAVAARAAGRRPGGRGAGCGAQSARATSSDPTGCRHACGTLVGNLQLELSLLQCSCSVPPLNARTPALPAEGRTRGLMKRSTLPSESQVRSARVAATVGSSSSLAQGEREGQHMLWQHGHWEIGSKQATL